MPLCINASVRFSYSSAAALFDPVMPPLIQVATSNNLDPSGTKLSSGQLQFSARGLVNNYED